MTSFNDCASDSRARLQAITGGSLAGSILRTVRGWIVGALFLFWMGWILRVLWQLASGRRE